MKEGAARGVDSKMGSEAIPGFDTVQVKGRWARWLTFWMASRAMPRSDGNPT